MTKKHDTAGI